MPLARPGAATRGVDGLQFSQKPKDGRRFIKSIQLAEASQRLSPGAVRGLAQHVPLKNGLAVIGSTGALWNVGQNRTEFREHHGSADVCAAGRELEAECLQSW
jgi:hypothetical protein